MTLGKLLHVLTMLTKLMCTLKVTFSMKVGPTEIKEDNSEILLSMKGGRLVLKGCQEGTYDSCNKCD